MILLLAAIAIGLLFYYKCVKPLNYWKNKGVIQGRPIPLFGDSLGTVIRTQSWLDSVISLYNMEPNARYVGVYQMTVPVLMIRDPELIKQITVKDFDHFLNHRDFVDPEADPLWGKNLFALKNQAWKDMRNTLSPTFTSSKMRMIFDLMHGPAKNIIDHFKEKDEEIVEVQMKDISTRFANDVIGSAAFGINLNSIKDRNNDFYTLGIDVANFKGVWQNLKIFLYLIVPNICKIFKLRLFPRRVQDFFSKIIEDSVRIREEQGIIRPDLIHMLMEVRKGKNIQDKETNIDTGYATVQEISITSLTKRKIEITNEDMVAQAMLFFFAGFDSVSTFMCLLTYELTICPDIQEKLRQEIFSTLEETNGKITYESLLKMKYLDMVVCETLRKWPQALMLDRVCTKPYTIEPKLPGEVPVHLNVGEKLWIAASGIHRDPKYYPNPEKFDPERFSEENVKNIKPYTYLPFGLGPRNCIGSRFALLETKLIVFNILANFELVPTAKTAIPLKLSKKGFNLSDDDGFPLGLKKLKKTSL